MEIFLTVIRMLKEVRQVPYLSLLLEKSIPIANEEAPVLQVQWYPVQQANIVKATD
jgi:hypothetical protein